MGDHHRLSKLPVAKISIGNTMRSRSSTRRQSEQIPKIRSSSVGRNLTPTVYQRLKTPQSAIEVRSKLGRYTPQSASSVRAEPRNEALEFTNVKKFIAQHDPSIKLKPLSIASFIQVINIFFKALELNESVTSQNFKEKLPALLKSLSYLTTVPATLMKSLNSPNAFPKILAIWSHLLMLVDSQMQDYDDDDDDDDADVGNSIINKIMVDHQIEKAISIFSSESIDENKYASKLADIYGYNSEECKVLGKSIADRQAAVDKYLKELRIMKESNKHPGILKEKKLELKTFEEVNLNNLNNFEGLKGRLEKILKDLETDTSKLNKRFDELNQFIAAFGYDQTAVQSIAKDIEELSYTITLSVGRNELLMSHIVEIDYEHADKIKEKLEKIYKINNNINDVFVRVIPTTKELLLPETRIFGLNFVEEINIRMDQLKIHLNNMMESIENEQNETSVLNKTFNAMQCKLKDLEIEEIKNAALYESVKIAQVELQNANERFRLLTLQLENEETKYQEIKQEHSNVIGHYRNLKKVAENRVKDLEVMKIQEFNKTTTFLTRVFIAVAQYMSALKEAFEKTSQVNGKKRCFKNLLKCQEELVAFKAELKNK